MKNAVRLCSGFVLAVGADLCVRPVGSVRWQCVTNAIAFLAHLWETLDSNCPGMRVVTMPPKGRIYVSARFYKITGFQTAYFASMTSIPPRYLRSTSGTTTEPSAR